MALAPRSRLLVRVAVLLLGGAATSCAARGAPGAIANASIAGALWVAEGCKLQGCVQGYTCNRKTERCEAIPCGGSCPVFKRCDTVRNVCVED